MFKVLIRTLFVSVLGLGIAATLVMTGGRSDAQGTQVPRGNLRPITIPPGGVPFNPFLPGLSPTPAMPGFVPNPNAIRTPLTPVPTPAGVPPVDPAGINGIVAGPGRPPLRPQQPGPIGVPSQSMSGQQQQGGIGGQQGGIGGQQGGIGGQIGGIGGQQGGIQGAQGIGGGQGGAGGTVLQPAFNLQGSVLTPNPFPGAGGIPVIQQPTFGPPWVPANNGGFGGQQIQGNNGGGQIQGVQGIQGQIGGIGGVGGVGGKIGFGGLYGY